MAKTDVHYRYDIPGKVTVQIDTREQRPMLFPSSIRIAHPELSNKEIIIPVKTEKHKLDFGDYRLKEYPNKCVIERKATAREVFKNLTDPRDRIRQAKSFRRLATSCEYPYLLVEMSPAEVVSSSDVKHPEIMANRLAIVIAKYKFQAIFLPWRSRTPATRRKAGALLVHLMLGCVLQEKFDVPPVLLEDLV